MSAPKYLSFSPKNRPTGRTPDSASAPRDQPTEAVSPGPAPRRKGPSAKERRTLAALRTSFRLLAPFPDLSGAVADHLFCTPRRFPRKAWEKKVLESGSSFTLSSNGRALRGVSYGEGPKVLLVHGWEGRGTQLSAFIEPLVEAGFSVWTFDMPAHGSSPGVSTDVLDMADAISAFAAQQGDIDTIVAHSLGTLATAFALDGGLSVRRLVLLAPTSSPLSAIQSMERMLGFGSVVLRRVRARLEARAGRPFEDVEDGNIFRGIDAETLVVHDPQDPEVPLLSVEGICEETQARVRWLPGVGHRGVLTSPEAVDTVARFVAQGTPARDEWSAWVRGDFKLDAA